MLSLRDFWDKISCFRYGRHCFGDNQFCFAFSSCLTTTIFEFHCENVKAWNIYFRFIIRWKSVLSFLASKLQNGYLCAVRMFQCKEQTFQTKLQQISNQGFLLFSNFIWRYTIIVLSSKYEPRYEDVWSKQTDVNSTCSRSYRESSGMTDRYEGVRTCLVAI